MVTRRKVEPDSPRPRSRRATTPEGRENQLIAAAYDLAERQIREGTASAQVISHFLKLGTTRERLEQERIMRENDLLARKAEALASAQSAEELFDRAIRAMSLYNGSATSDEPERRDD